MSAALDLLGAAAQNRSLEADAVEIRLRATRKLDELSAGAEGNHRSPNLPEDGG
jgi:hypothetical protein